MPWLLGVLLLVKLGAAAWLIRELKRLRLVSIEFVWKGLGIWIAACAGLSATTLTMPRPANVVARMKLRRAKPMASILRVNNERRESRGRLTRVIVPQRRINTEGYGKCVQSRWLN